MLTIIFLEKEIEKEIVLETIKEMEIKIREIVVEEIPNCYNPFRNQYNAECLLNYFLLKYKPLILIVIDKDIYVEGMNFVFGLAYPFRGCIVSFYRLYSEDKERYYSRIKKEIKHELGHVFGLKHCKYPCVMAFSNSVFEVDLKDDFCERCKRILKENIKMMSFQSSEL